MQSFKIPFTIALGLVILFTWTQCSTPSEDLSVEPFNVIGMTVITSLKGEQNTTDISILWGQLYAQKVIQKIPNKIDDDIYIVYTDYASNPDDGFRVIMGAKVSSLDSIPKGLTGRRIQGGAYKRYVARGDMPKAINNLWSEIRLMDSSHLQRNYVADYEVYDRKSISDPDVGVELYISVRKPVNN